MSDGRVPGEQRLVLPVLGVQTTFVSAVPEALQAVREAYGDWGMLDPVRISASTGRVTLLVEPHRELASEADDAPDPVCYSVPDRTRMLARTSRASGSSDTVRREVVVAATSPAVYRTAGFRTEILDPMILFLVGAQDRQPLHAAAVAREGAALVLAGPSGVGKSTLSYAASRSGFQVLSDEAVYVQIHPRVRIWAWRAGIRLRPEARDHFVELAGVPPLRMTNGREKVLVRAAASAPRFAERVSFCVLSRAVGDSPQLQRISAAEAVARSTAALDPGFDLFAATIGERIAALAQRGAWSLALAGPPDAALPLLEQVADELRRAD